MRVLLDTHALLWYYDGNPKLPSRVVQLIDEPDTEAYISGASFHEIAIKVSLGQLTVAAPLTVIAQDFIDLGFGFLPVLPAHTEELARLPFYREHRDPFDRILIAQALVEKLVLLSGDKEMPRYAPPLQLKW